MHLFIDGKNAIYRAVYASQKSKGLSFTYLIRQIASWMIKYNPDSVHVFWDAPRAEVWRRKIHPTYKDREGNEYIENIKPEIEKTINQAQILFNNMGIRQYSKKSMEADDLIYAAVNVLYPQNIAIVSTDGDMAQIIYRYNNVTLFNSSTNCEVKKPEHDPVYMKILTGDKSDTIEGFRGIGDKKATALLESKYGFYDFSKDNKEKFKFNMVLVDLSVCPHLMINKLYCMDILSKIVNYDNQKIIDSCKELKLTSYLMEHNNYAPHFRKLK
jgi:5'-3' exonuclease